MVEIASFRKQEEEILKLVKLQQPSVNKQLKKKSRNQKILIHLKIY
jgi:hypothetical protein